jgi:hypothetical protein
MAAVFVFCRWVLDSPIAPFPCGVDPAAGVWRDGVWRHQPGLLHRPSFSLVVTGLHGFLESSCTLEDSQPRAPRHREVAIAMMLVMASIALSLLLLPPDMVARPTPKANTANNAQLLAGADRGADAQPVQPSDQPTVLSIAAAHTPHGFTGAVGLAALLMGASREFPTVGAVMFTTLLAIAIHHPPPRPVVRGHDGR